MKVLRLLIIFDSITKLLSSVYIVTMPNSLCSLVVLLLPVLDEGVHYSLWRTALE